MKTVVFDIDGTISVAGQKVSDELCRKLEELAQNHRLIFASARPVRDMLPMLSEGLHQKAIWIGCNGAMAYQNGRFLFADTIPTEQVKSILDFLHHHQLPYVLDGKWSFSLSAVSHPFHQYITSLSNEQLTEAELVQDGISKILILSNHQKAALCDLVGGSLAVHTHKTEDIFDITPNGNNKYHTLTKLIGDVPYIAFGNDQNDFLMLDNAEISVFVGEPSMYASACFYTQTEHIAGLLDGILPFDK